VGDAINFDGPDAAVRGCFAGTPILIDEFHLDGLRPTTRNFSTARPTAHAGHGARVHDAARRPRSGG
jgi:hypothetical protein